MSRTALILVDLQHDFMPGGALAVAGGDETVAVANRLIPSYELVVATQDWHPAQHESFAANHAGRQPGEVIDLHGLPQVLWPVHCVQGTAGAALHSALDVAGIDFVVRKGTDPAVDSYSAFYDNGHRQTTGLAAELRRRGVEAVHILGLATDYCVKFTALDAVAEGFATTLLLEGCRGVELTPGDTTRALDALQAAGVTVRDREPAGSP
ncbi:MAG: bifunctional nicotinamidase/pyrazinamidase [Planctomycetota bacterium]